MKPAPFSYHAPTSVNETVEFLREFGDEAKVIAGGQSLVPMMALRLARFDHLVDLNGVEQLRSVQRENGTLSIGAMTTHRDIERGLAQDVPLLARVAPHIGHTQIRNRGTVGGSCAHADPSAEWPAVALTLDAQFEVRGPKGGRTIPAADFFVSTFMTSLEPDEILLGLNIPIWAGRCGFGVAEFARRHGDFALAGATVALQVDEAGRVSRLAIGLDRARLDSIASRTQPNRPRLERTYEVSIWPSWPRSPSRIATRPTTSTATPPIAVRWAR